MVENIRITTIKVSKETHAAINKLIGFNGCRYADDVIQRLLKRK